MDTRNFTEAYVDEEVQTVVDDIRNSCESLPDPAIVDVSMDIEWFDVLPVIVGIERCVTVRVIGHVGFLAGQPYQAVENTDPNVFIEPGRDADGRNVIARSDLLNVSTLPSES
jgi:hypothetical protein